MKRPEPRAFTPASAATAGLSSQAKEAGSPARTELSRGKRQWSFPRLASALLLGLLFLTVWLKTGAADRGDRDRDRDRDRSNKPQPTPPGRGNPNQDLQEFDNEFRAKLDLGMAEADQNQDLFKKGAQ